MRLSEHVWANCRGLWARYLSLFLLGVVAVSTIAASRILSTAAEDRVISTVTQSVAQRAITVENNHEQGVLLDLDMLTRLSSIPGVATVEPTFPVPVDLNLPDTPIGFDIVPVRPSMAPPVVASTRDAVFPLSDGEVVLPARLDGRDMGGLLGTTISLAHPSGMGEGASTSVVEEVRVVALSDPSWQDDGPRSGYADAAVARRWFEDAAKPSTMAQVLELQGVDRVTVTTGAARDVDEVLAAIQALGVSAVAFQQMTPTLPDAMASMSRLTDVMQWVLAVVCAVAVFAIVRSLLLQRTREIGLLKALGHSSGRVAGVLLLEGVVVAWAACMCSVAVSLVLANVLRPLMPSDMLPGGLGPIWVVDWSVVGWSFVAAALVVLVGWALSFLRALRLDAAEALRDWR